jgi:hypothetical protein
MFPCIDRLVAAHGFVSSMAALEFSGQSFFKEISRIFSTITSLIFCRDADKAPLALETYRQGLYRS